jgi:large subunit ribosomal protein L25
MQVIKLNAITRSESGKGAARRVRTAGRIPAVAYGKQLSTQALAVSPEQLGQVLNSEHGRNSVVELEVEGQPKITAMIRDYQYHPVTRRFLHADFIQIQMDSPVDVEVVLELSGKPQGVVLGGTLRQVFRKVPVRSLPDKIPVKLTHDVTSLGLDGHVMVRDLVLPEGVSVRLPPERTLVAIVKEKQAPEEEEKPGAAAAATPSKAPPADTDKKSGDKKSSEKK